MSYISNTDEDLQKIFKEIGISSVEELFSDIPKEIRLKEELDLPPSLSEKELIDFFQKIAAKNKQFKELPCFIGAGNYFHYVPAVVKDIVSRSEFYTAYTPYQAEISQGTLQATFEYQSFICILTQMEVSNASMYDGATAVAEAILMAQRINNKSEVILASSLHPEYKEVVKTYLKNVNISIKELPFTETGEVDIEELGKKLTADTSAVIIQNPNFFGVIEDYQKIFPLLDEKVMKIVVITEPLSLGILKPPGQFAADIVVGEGQSFGLAPAYGGPGFGFLATKYEYVRKMPGRLVGVAYDNKGNRGFVLTLSTREQHIRREKATSNICTNQALCALAATVYLSLLGPKGLKKLANLNTQNAHYLQEKLCKNSNCNLKFKGPFFNEFTLEINSSVDKLLHHLYDDGFIGGLHLKKFYPELENCLLINCTEMHNKEIMDRFIESFLRFL